MEQKKIPSETELKEALANRHGIEIQEKLSASGVAVCGLGGLGSAVAIALARAGVGRLHLIDFDRVDLSNLNRQQYALNQIGMAKPRALAEEIRRFAPYCSIRQSYVKLTEDNIPRLLAGETYICEAFDDAEAKAMLTNCVLEHFPGKYLVGASGMAGFGGSNEIITKRILPNYYLCGDGVSEVGAVKGNCLMAPRVMVCAAHQANILLQLMIEN